MKKHNNQIKIYFLDCIFHYFSIFETIDKITKAIGEEGKTIAKEANFGFCEFFWFKCAGARVCDAWVGGGPIK